MSNERKMEFIKWSAVYFAVEKKRRNGQIIKEIKERNQK